VLKSKKSQPDIHPGFQELTFYRFNAEEVSVDYVGNNPLAISSTILSRFTAFRIEAPSGQDALTMAEAMLSSSHTGLNKTDFSMPGRDIARLIAHLSPREHRQTIETAFASAIANGRDRLIRGDLPADIHLAEESVKRRKSRQWIH
jgi:hypothetical protein